MFKLHPDALSAAGFLALVDRDDGPLARNHVCSYHLELEQGYARLHVYRFVYPGHVHWQSHLRVVVRDHGFLGIVGVGDFPTVEFVLNTFVSADDVASTARDIARRLS